MGFRSSVDELKWAMAKSDVCNQSEIHKHENISSDCELAYSQR
jgi:hypothetical protein